MAMVGTVKSKSPMKRMRVSNDDDNSSTDEASSGQDEEEKGMWMIGRLGGPEGHGRDYELPAAFYNVTSSYGDMILLRHAKLTVHGPSEKVPFQLYEYGRPG